MKSLRKLLYIIPLTGMMVTSCMDVENIEIDHIGGYATMNNAESEAYYANLRAYKATAWNYNRPVAFGWYSNWAPAGAYRRGYLSAIGVNPFLHVRFELVKHLLYDVRCCRKNVKQGTFY